MRFVSLVLMLGMLGACRAASDEGLRANPVCIDDAGEDDDTLEQGRAATPVSHIFNHGPLKLDRRVACPGDEDWIHVYGDCCYPAGAVVRWDATRGALEAELLDSEGKPLPLNAPGDTVQRQPGEVRLLRAEHGGDFLVRVRAVGAETVPYSVDVFAPVFVR